MDVSGRPKYRVPDDWSANPNPLAPGNWGFGEGGEEMGFERMSGAKGRHPGHWEQTRIPVSGGRRMDR